MSQTPCDGTPLPPSSALVGGEPLAADPSGLPPADHPEVKRLAAVLLSLPAEHRDEIIVTAARVAVAWQLRADLSELVRFARSVAATAELCSHSAARASLQARPARVADASMLRSIEDAFPAPDGTGATSQAGSVSDTPDPDHAASGEPTCDEREGVVASPHDYTHPDVCTIGVAEGWAEAETDPTRINWPERQARAAIPFEVIGGRPLNPCERTGVRHGRNQMGFWGEQQMADALVTLTVGGVRHLLLIERRDGYGWAVPGGHVEPGESGVHAAVRELAEETGLSVPTTACQALPARYVPDPRASDEAWAVTIPVRVILGARATPEVKGGDDARRAAWLRADSYAGLVRDLEESYGGHVFAAHVAMLADLLAEADMATATVGVMPAWLRDAPPHLGVALVGLGGFGEQVVAPGHVEPRLMLAAVNDFCRLRPQHPDPYGEERLDWVFHTWAVVTAPCGGREAGCDCGQPHIRHDATLANAPGAFPLTVMELT